MTEMNEYVVYGPNAPFGNSIGEWGSEEAAQAYADSGKEGDFGANAYVCLANFETKAQRRARIEEGDA